MGVFDYIYGLPTPPPGKNGISHENSDKCSFLSQNFYFQIKFCIEKLFSCVVLINSRQNESLLSCPPNFMKFPIGCSTQFIFSSITYTKSMKMQNMAKIAERVGIHTDCKILITITQNFK